MAEKQEDSITDIIGKIPYRIALAGGWIDQPFMSSHNPAGTGSMVVISIVPEFRWMDRAGIASSTRSLAIKLWDGVLPDEDPEKLVRFLYEAENKGKAEPSGSQDMIGIIYPGISRLDYDHSRQGGYFPAHIESCNDPEIAEWLQSVLYILPVNTRPDGYQPLKRKDLRPDWVKLLGQTGKDCYNAILRKDITNLAYSFNECMECWHTLLPDILGHPTLPDYLIPLLRHYQDNYTGAMYSGCGGGYLFVISDKPVPGAFQCKIRTSNNG